MSTRVSIPAIFVLTLCALAARAADDTPVFSSPPSVSNNPASPGEKLLFSAAATAPSGVFVTFTWDFGDGGTGSGNKVFHIYTAEGTYNATCIAHGNTSTASATIAVTVREPIGGGVDSDGDGFSDSFETAVGSDTALAASTPLGSAPAEQAQLGVLSVKKAQIVLRFNGKGSHSIKLTGALTTDANFSPANKIMVVRVGSFVSVFPLDAKGKGKNGKSKVTIAVKGKVPKTSRAHDVAQHELSVTIQQPARKPSDQEPPSQPYPFQPNPPAPATPDLKGEDVAEKLQNDGYENANIGVKTSGGGMLGKLITTDVGLVIATENPQIIGLGTLGAITLQVEYSSVKDEIGKAMAKLPK